MKPVAFTKTENCRGWVSATHSNRWVRFGFVSKNPESGRNGNCSTFAMASRLRCFVWALIVTVSGASALAEAPDRARFDFASARQHWAYRPIKTPPLPVVKDRQGVQTDLDLFVLARLQEKNLEFAPQADPRTRIRRVFFGLTGLPPSFEEVEAFAQDPSPAAFSRIVDRLLGSPRFGERWARHWLDVARFAETKDLVLLYGKDRIRPFAYTYRDYVIRAFNEDLPFADFVDDQLAADATVPPDQTWRLAGMGFLTLGKLFDENPHDIYDDQIDTVSRGFLGLTVSCARCHDHKYDPITIEDYYAWYGVFASSERPLDAPLLENPASVPGAEAFERELAAKRKELEAHVEKEFNEIIETARQRAGDYLTKVATEKAGLNENAVFYLSLSPEDLRPGLLSRWRRYIHQQTRPGDPVFGPWHELIKSNDEEFATKTEEYYVRLENVQTGVKEGELNPILKAALQKARPMARADLARVYGDVFKAAYEQWKQDGGKPISNPATSPAEQLVSVLVSKDGPIWFPKSNTYLHMSRVPRDKFGGMVNGLDKLAAHATNAPPARAMMLVDAPELVEPRVFLRGNPANPGAKVPRRFLELLSEDGARPVAFVRGSGRLDLARAIASPKNPLTSRVFVNRVWMHLMGEPLVATPSDFGNRSTPPTHPELLDFLASRFLAEGGSLKSLIRQIVLSTAYQQSSADRPEARALDPDNRLLWRAHKRRLDFESMRDSLLAVSGRLDPAMGGRSVDVAGDPQNRRRTLYGLVDRQDVPQMFRAFDFASPDQSADRRPQTIVPQQALFALNSAFVVEQAKALAARIETGGDVSQRARLLYRLVLAREPSEDELARARDFLGHSTGSSAGAALDSNEPDALNPWQQLAQVLLLTNEFHFID